MAARRTRRAAAAAATGLFAAACAALVLAAVPAAAAASATTPTTLPLSEGPWKLANANGSLSYSDIAIPAYPHQVLQSKGVIADPLYRYNELLTRWVCDDTWTYSREFVASPAQAASPAADLVFKGLDTFATVTLNGDVILRADNFHRTWRVPVQGLLKAGKNTLTIALEPAEATAVRLKREMPYTVNALHQPGGMDIYNYARKGAYSFGWGEFWFGFFCAGGGPSSLATRCAR
jgi:beta-mannosidase